MIPISPPATTTAYLVGFYNPRTMRYHDAGIYSEERPTVIDVRNIKSRCLLKATVKGWPRYEQAKQRVLEGIAAAPELHWVRRAPSFRSQEESDARMRAVMAEQRRR